MARVVSGVGVGMATVIIPMYSAEMAPKHIRGMLGGLFQFLFTCGVMTSYWVDYGVAQHMKKSTAQWQIAIGLQLVPGSILGLGMLLTKESTRWLAKRGQLERAMDSLVWVRGGERTTEVEEEYVQCVYASKHFHTDIHPGSLRSLPVSRKSAVPPRASHGESFLYLPIESESSSQFSFRSASR